MSCKNSFEFHWRIRWSEFFSLCHFAEKIYRLFIYNDEEYKKAGGIFFLKTDNYVIFKKVTDDLNSLFSCHSFSSCDFSHSRMTTMWRALWQAWFPSLIAHRRMRASSKLRFGLSQKSTWNDKAWEISSQSSWWLTFLLLIAKFCLPNKFWQSFGKASAHHESSLRH